MKKRFKFLLSIAIPAIIVAPIATLSTTFISSPKSTNKDEEYINNKPLNFVDNINEYKKKIFQTNQKILTPQNFDIENNFTVLPSDPNNNIYKKIFNQINYKIIENDLYYFISNLRDNYYNKNFLINVSDIKILSIDNDNWDIKLKFQIYNKTNFVTKYLYNNYLRRIVFKPYEKKDCELTIKGKINYAFDRKNNEEKYSDVYVSYFFNSSTWIFNNYKEEINNFYFNKFSNTINTIIKYVINGTKKSYLDIKDEATTSLKKLTLDDIKNDINNTTTHYINNTLEILDNTQRVLQNLVQNYNDNVSAKRFLIDNANYIGVIVEKVLCTITNTNFNVKNIVSSIFADSKLYDIIFSKNNSIEIISILSKINPDFLDIYNDLLNNTITSVESFNDLVDSTIELVFKGLSDSEKNVIKQMLDSIKTQGFLSAIIQNKGKILEILKQLNLFPKEIYDIIASLTNIADFENKNMIDVLVDLLKSKDNNGVAYLKTILSMFNFIPADIQNMLDQIIFNNENFNSKNFSLFINSIANPKSSPKSNEVINYKLWFDSIQKNISWGNEDQYNNSTCFLNLNYNYKITFTSDLYINLVELTSILPNDLNINGNAIPISLIKSLIMPSWIGIKKNDYINYSMFINDFIWYDVVKKDNNDVLSWKAPIRSIIDVSMPQTVKTLYDTSPALSSGNEIISFSKDIFYHEYDSYSMFKPITCEKMNKVIIKNYSYEIKTNEAFFTKQISNERLIEIQNLIKNSTSNVDVLDKNNQPYKFIIKKGSWLTKDKIITKTKTKSTFDYNSIVDELFDRTYLKSSIIVQFNNNIFVNSFKAAGVITIDTIKSTNIDIYLPYYIFTNDNKFADAWKINL